MLFPPTFVQPPARYSTPLAPIERLRVSQDDAMRLCGGHMTIVQVAPASGRWGSSGFYSVDAMACATLDLAHGVCREILPTPESWRGSPEALKELEVHEDGHCGGWPSDHPL